jgi:hypothetical protein
MSKAALCNCGQRTRTIGCPRLRPGSPAGPLLRKTKKSQSCSVASLIQPVPALFQAWLG